MTIKTHVVLSALLASACLMAGTVAAHEHEEAITYESTPLSKNLYMLQSGKGGNLALSVGEDGLLLIDDDYAEISEKTRAAIAGISAESVKFVVNTHWHFDHTGGNQMLGEEGAIIVAHDNVRKRLLSGGEIKAFSAQIPPAKKAALPVLTFADSMTFHWNGTRIDVVHPGASGHTDGDAVIYFVEDNVVHMGDLYFAGLYPFIDGSSGGSLAGIITSVDKVLARIDGDTRVIPGHGPLSNKSELQVYRGMLTSVQKKLMQFKQQEKTVEQVVAAKPTAEFDAKWGHGFLNADTWVAIVYQTL